MATVKELNTALALEHIRVLGTHGARIQRDDGTSIPLNVEFYHDAVKSCEDSRCVAITYRLSIPEVNEPLLLAAYRDGRVYTGSEETIMRCLDT